MKTPPSTTPQFPQPIQSPFPIQTFPFSLGSLLRAKPPLAAPQVLYRARPPLRCLPKSTTHLQLVETGPHPQYQQPPRDAPRPSSDFAPSTVPLPPVPQASAAPAPHPSTTRQHAPRPRPLTAHDAGGPVRKASGERLARSEAHTSLWGDRRGLEASGAPTRFPPGCDSLSNDCLLGLPGSPATASWPRPSARTAPPPPPSADLIGSRPRCSRADPASPHRPAPPFPGAHAGAGLLAAKTWQRLVAASAWGSWSRPALGRAAGGIAPRGRKKLGDWQGMSER